MELPAELTRFEHAPNGRQSPAEPIARGTSSPCRAYWPDPAIIEGKWKPPVIAMTE
jgi:hypothetical protein